MEQTTDLHSAMSPRNLICSSSEGGILILESDLTFEIAELVDGWLATGGSSKL